MVLTREVVIKTVDNLTTGQPSKYRQIGSGLKSCRWAEYFMVEFQDEWRQNKTGNCLNYTMLNIKFYSIHFKNSEADTTFTMNIESTI